MICWGRSSSETCSLELLWSAQMFGLLALPSDVAFPRPRRTRWELPRQAQKCAGQPMLPRSQPRARGEQSMGGKRHPRGRA